ncbi:MAG: AAA family ATPase [Chryseolinea sp.]
MKLLKISISNFRSIIEAKDINLDDKITTLVGANEHGKSTLLNAVKYLDKNYEFDFVKDVRYDQETSIFYPVIDYQIVLTDEEKTELEELITSSLNKLDVDTAKPEVKTTQAVTEEIDEKSNETIEILPSTNVFTLRRTYSKSDSLTTLVTEAEVEYSNLIIAYIENYYQGRVIYFDDFDDRLPSLITLTELNDQENLIVKGLMKLSGLEKVRTRLFEDSLQARNLVKKLLEAAPDKLTTEVVKNWFQGLTDTIKIIIHKNDSTQTLRVDIEDKNTIVDLDSRSRGFRWYLSFFLKHRAYSDGELKGCLFLLDEPGLFLHPRGQKDLLSFFETLSKYNQIIYTTHSPFMINRLHRRRVRVIEKFENAGTKVNAKGFVSNWKPLRSSLGLTLSDSFFYADKTLLVEGPEDKIYILTLLQLYAKLKNIDIDLNILSIIDSGGISEMPAVARIIGEEDRKYIVFTDSDVPKQVTRLKKIVKHESDLKEVKNFKENSQIIQELLPVNLFVQAVNDYINQLVNTNIIVLKQGISKGNFVYSTGIRIDKQVKTFVSELYDEDDISKVGIASEFERIVLDTDFDATQFDFQPAYQLIEWVITQLNLKSETVEI